MVTNEPHLLSVIEQRRLNYRDHDLIKFCDFNEIVFSSTIQIVFRAWKKADTINLTNDIELTLDLNQHLTCVDTIAEILVDSMDFAETKPFQLRDAASNWQFVLFSTESFKI